MSYFRNASIVLPLLFFLILGTGCNENTDMVDSGTYEGTIEKVTDEQTEVFMVTDDDKRLRLYFTDQTQVTHNGALVPMDHLQENQQVRATVEKVGQRLHLVEIEVTE